jgi:hypothetical protein
MQRFIDCKKLMPTAEQSNANLSTAASERKKLKYSKRSTERLAASLAASTDCHIFG